MGSKTSVLDAAVDQAAQWRRDLCPVTGFGTIQTEKKPSGSPSPWKDTSLARGESLPRPHDTRVHQNTDVRCARRRGLAFSTDS